MAIILAIQAAAAAGAAAEPSSGGLPQFDAAQWPGQIVWLLVIFGLMFILFAKVFTPGLASTIAAREDRIAGDIGDARRMKDQADAEAAAAAAETAQARARAQQLAFDAKARVQAEASAEDAREQAKLAETLAKNEARIASMRDEAMTHVREISFNAASAIVDKLTGQAPTVGELNAAQARGDA